MRFTQVIGDEPEALTRDATRKVSNSTLGKATFASLFPVMELNASLDDSDLSPLEPTREWALRLYRGAARTPRPTTSMKYVGATQWAWCHIRVVRKVTTAQNNTSWLSSVVSFPA